MAITYHAGRRIQGTSSDFAGAPETGTAVHDFSFSSAPANWNYRVEGSSSHWDNDNSRLNWETKSASSGSGADYDLGVQTDNWTLRFKIRIDSSQSGYVSAGQGDGVVMFGLQNYPSTSAYTCSTPNSQNDSTYAETHQMAQMMLLFKSAQTEGSGKYRVGGRCETTTTGNWSGAELDVNINDDTDYYIEVKRTSPTTFTISVGSNSDYSTGRTTGTYTVTANSLDGLRYIHLEDHAQNSLYDSYGGGILTDLEFWSGDASGTAKPTNVQVGSRLEETDTRKMYHYETAPNVIIDFDAGGEATASNWTHPTTASGGNSGAHGFSITTEPTLGGNAGTINNSGRDWDSTIDMVTHCGLEIALPAQTQFVIEWDYYRHSGDSSDHPSWAFSSEAHGVDPHVGASGKEIGWGACVNGSQCFILMQCKDSSSNTFNMTYQNTGSIQATGTTKFWRATYDESEGEMSLQRWDTAVNRTAGGATGREFNVVTGAWSGSGTAGQTAWKAAGDIRYFTLETYNNGQKAFSVDNVTWYDDTNTAVGTAKTWKEEGT